MKRYVLVLAMACVVVLVVISSALAATGSGGTAVEPGVAPAGAAAAPEGLTAADWADIYNQVTTRLGDDVTPAPSLTGADFGSAVQQAYLKASNTQGLDCFGWSVAVSGDTVVVGAYGEDSSATGVNGSQADGASDSGAAYVFVRSGTTWTQQAYLKASNTGAEDRFGYSVAVSGDTVVVGAYGEDSNSTGIDGNQTDNSARNSGAAYVFTRNGTTWTQQAYLKASNTGAADWFGQSVAVSGDTVVVGALYECSNATGVDGNQADNSATSSGAAYVFTRSGSIWTQQAYLKASNTGAPDLFGQSVAISGDTALVGAYQESSNATGVNGSQSDDSAWAAGAAYVFTRSATTWTQQAYLKASNTGMGDWFGKSVAISGDTVVVGAVYEDSSATGVDGDQADNSADEAGAAYVFIRSGTTWSQQAYLKASNTDPSDYFGVAVAASGDAVVVGAGHEDSNATGVNGSQGDNSVPYAGAAYVFGRASGAWSQQAYLKASNTEEGDYFADSVALSGDTVVVSAYVEGSTASGVNGNQSDNTAWASGAAYVFAVSSAAASSLTYTGVWLDADADGGTPLAATLSCADDSTLVAGKTVGFFVDLDHNDVFASPDELVGSGTTDAAGHVTVDWHHDGALTGTFPVKASFAGTAECQASSAQDTVVLGQPEGTVAGSADGRGAYLPSASSTKTATFNFSVKSTVSSLTGSPAGLTGTLNWSWGGKWTLASSRITDFVVTEVPGYARAMVIKGTGVLRELGRWGYLSSTQVTFIAVACDGGTTMVGKRTTNLPDGFGIDILAADPPGESEPVKLKSGSVVLPVVLQ